MAYPGSLDSFTTKTGADVIASAHINAVQTSIVAAQTELGTDPAGSMTDVKTRLAVSLADDGDLALAGVSTLTISSGSITVTGNRHLVDTQGSAATDDLDTINGGSAGMVVILRIVADARNVVITNAGNIVTPGGVSINLDYTNQGALLWYDGGLSKWMVIGAPVLRQAISAPTGTYTALTTDQVILADGTFTITLPAVAAANGVRLEIKNIGTGTVTVDGAGAETIDGAANYLLVYQYQSVTVVCNGSAWFVL